MNNIHLMAVIYALKNLLHTVTVTQTATQTQHKVSNRLTPTHSPSLKQQDHKLIDFNAMFSFLLLLLLLLLLFNFCHKNPF